MTGVIGGAIIKIQFTFNGEFMSILTGEYYHTVDAKNRIRIPSKLKADMGIETAGEEDEQKKFSLIFHTGTNRCLAVYTQEAIDKKFAFIENIKENETEKYMAARKYLRTFETVESDPQGRLVIPQKFKDQCLIKKDIIICGMIDHVEIWAKDVYNDYFGETTPEEMDRIVNTLGV